MILENLTDEFVGHFMANLTETDNGCMEWKGGKSLQGYGYCRLNGRMIGTHRVAWAICQRREPGDLLVRHTCDNPPCCNPRHLLIGTRSDNALDFISRHSPKGKVLSACNVRELRARLDGLKGTAMTECIRELAPEYGVSVGHLYSVAKGYRWASLS